MLFQKGNSNVEEDVLETTDEQFSFGDSVSLYQRSKPVDPVKLWRKVGVLICSGFVD